APRAEAGKHADADSLYFGSALVGGRDSTMACAWPVRSGGTAVGKEVLVITFDPPAWHRAKVLKDSTACSGVPFAPRERSARLTIENAVKWKPQYGILVNDPGAKASVAGDGVRVSLHGVGGSFTFMKLTEGRSVGKPEQATTVWTTVLTVYHDGSQAWQHEWHLTEEELGD